MTDHKDTSKQPSAADLMAQIEARREELMIQISDYRRVRADAAQALKQLQAELAALPVARRTRKVAAKGASRG